LPQMLAGASASACRRRTRELMERTGIAPLARKKPHQISGGEQQRTAISVALANSPALLLADEPTGELDSTTAGEILSLLRELNRELGLTILIVTHDIAVASVADRTIAIRDGRTSTETVRREAPLAGSGATGGGGSSEVIGLPSETHRESVLIDRVGRLQLPHEAILRIPFNGRANVRILDDHVEIWPAEAAGAPSLAASPTDEALAPSHVTRTPEEA
ncbi:MAG: ABC transporter ATP-binding protein, partial [Ktedonobacterales bacterium]